MANPATINCTIYNLDKHSYNRERELVIVIKTELMLNISKFLYLLKYDVGNLRNNQIMIKKKCVLST